jgi:hypothetical protein
MAEKIRWHIPRKLKLSEINDESRAKTHKERM